MGVYGCAAAPAGAGGVGGLTGGFCVSFTDRTGADAPLGRAGAGKVLVRLSTLTDLEDQLGELLRVHPRFTVVGTTVPLYLLHAAEGVGSGLDGRSRANAKAKAAKKGKAHAPQEPIDGEETVRPQAVLAGPAAGGAVRSPWIQGADCGSSVLTRHRGIAGDGHRRANAVHEGHTDWRRRPAQGRCQVGGT